jgi:general secretion pathway protein A
MYESHFSLRKRAFDLAPNPSSLLLIRTHREALGNLLYGLESKQGITLLVGEAGTGKTTVMRRALASLERAETGRLQAVTLTNPLMTRAEFLEVIADSFALGGGAAQSKARLLRRLEQRLRDQRQRGVSHALVIDEAQTLSDDLLEEVRLLANIELDTEKLLPLVLVGQPEIATRLNEPQLRQLKQRVALRCTLSPLDASETACYIAGRIRRAGGDPVRLFSREAVAAIYERSRGIPRTVSVICENALLTAFATGAHRIEREMVDEVARDFDLPRPLPSAGPFDEAEDEASAPAAIRSFQSAAAQSRARVSPLVVHQVSREQPE